MKNIFRKNQIIITALAIMIVVAGYLNFTRDKVNDKQVADDLTSNDVFSELNGDTYDVTDDGTLDLSEEDIQDAEVPVEEANATDENDAKETTSTDVKDAEEVAAADDTKEGTDTAEAKDSEDTPGEAVLASTNISASYFSSVKIEREQMRSKNRTTYMDILEKENVSEEQKQEAIDCIIESAAIAEKENAAEIQLGAQGFANVVVSMVEGKVTVVVSDDGLSEQQIAQIEDTTKNATGVAADKITIKPVTVKEE